MDVIWRYSGKKSSDMTIKPIIRVHEKRYAGQKRLRINGTSLKKFEASTSLIVAPQTMS